MCAVSMIGDHYTDKWRLPDPYGGAPSPMNPFPVVYTLPINPVTREEFDALKKEVQEMKALLIRAKKYDEDNGQADCEIDDKVAILKKVAELVGIDLSEVFGK